MRRNVLETILGGLVLLIAGTFLVFAWRTSEVQAVQGYQVTARFLKVGGLEAGSDVRINGVKVGTVVARELDLANFEAVVTMTIAPRIQLPGDTVAVITSDGLFGGKYVRLIPGAEEAHIGAGGEIEKTRDFKSLEDSVSEIIFLATGGK